MEREREKNEHREKEQEGGMEIDGEREQIESQRLSERDGVRKREMQIGEERKRKRIKRECEQVRGMEREREREREREMVKERASKCIGV